MDNIKTVISDDQCKDELKGLIQTSYDNQSFQIGKLLSIYRQVLESKGVDSVDQQKMYNLFYSVKNEMERDGLIKTIKHSVYYYSSEGVDDYSEEEAGNDLEADMEGASEDKLSPETQVIGEGSGEVYLYYYPAYAELARLKGEKSYRCKIGMTTYDHKQRFSYKVKSEEPEHRTISLVIKTDFPADLEKILHMMLRIAGKQLDDAPGREWFYTNPEEIVEIYNNMAKFSSK